MDYIAPDAACDINVSHNNELYAACDLITGRSMVYEIGDKASATIQLSKRNMLGVGAIDR